MPHFKKPQIYEQIEVDESATFWSKEVPGRDSRPEIKLEIPREVRDSKERSISVYKS